MPTALHKQLGKVLARLRERRGYTQEAFANHYGFDRAWMSKVENGRKDIQLSAIKRLADALGVSVWKLLRDAEKG